VISLKKILTNYCYSLYYYYKNYKNFNNNTLLIYFNQYYYYFLFFHLNIWKFVFFNYFNKINFINLIILTNHNDKAYYINKLYNNNNIFFFKNNIKILIIYKYLSKIVNLAIFNIKWILLGLIIALLYFVVSLFYIQIEFTKQIGAWFVVLFVFYLLISTFNNFLIKYKYGKFTSAIQRFWKRTGLVFWLIEGFLFLLFFYYFLNSSQEPLYMFDYSSLNQEFLLQLKISYKNMILISLAIYLSFILILNNNFLNYYQNILLLILISLIIFYILFLETYQFVYIISLFSEKNWVFDNNTQLWVLNFEKNNLRVKQQYFVMCLIAKYWHFIFIFISWFFFLIKCLELNKINYNLMGYNVQNLIILYILNLFCLIQWIKWLFKKFLEIIYFWFHVQFDEKFFFIIQNEIFNTIKSFFFLDNNLFFTIKLKILSITVYYFNNINLWKII